jgi:glucose-1-phosphate thymidylyltransferase
MFYEEASRYGLCDTNEYGKITRVVGKRNGPQSNHVMTGFSTFTPAPSAPITSSTPRLL